MPWRTVARHPSSARRVGFPSRNEQYKIDRCLALVELGDFGEFHRMQLSGGKQQSASIARAFAIEPDILLRMSRYSALDELTEAACVNSF